METSFNALKGIDEVAIANFTFVNFVVSTSFLELDETKPQFNFVLPASNINFR